MIRQDKDPTDIILSFDPSNLEFKYNNDSQYQSCVIVHFNSFKDPTILIMTDLAWISMQDIE